MNYLPSFWIWEKDHFVPTSGVPVSDRGFRYGMSVFESLRVAGGEAEFFEQHAVRLMQACAEREFAVAAAALGAVPALWNRTGASGFARIYVTAGDGGPTSAVERPRMFVFLEDRTPPSPDETWEIALHGDIHRPLFGGLKTANYWSHCDALARARRRGFEEALLFNECGELVSACMANVFLVCDGQLYTPPRSSGARDGVIREWVMGRQKVEERRLRREDVSGAEEIFLTNSWIGVRAVAAVDGRALGPLRIAPRLAAELAERRRLL